MIDWTAVASIAAAIAAFLSWLQSRRSHLASIRPVLIFKDWTYYSSDKEGRAIVQAPKLQNVGQGTALFVSISGGVQGFSSELYVGEITSLAPKEECFFAFRVRFPWPPETEAVVISLKMKYSDSDSNSYETRLSFRAFRAVSQPGPKKAT
jgi:hypothetical protein